ncbi:MAG: SRPBCC family protein [Ornithinibacter sp.]
MAFTITRNTTVTATAVWDAVSDLAAHSRHVPLTEVRVPDGGLVLGSEIVARTGVGPLGFADRMLVTGIEPGDRLRLVKTGLWLRGWAEITVEPDGDGARVVWVEELWLPGMRLLTKSLGDRLGPLLFGPVLDALLAGASRSRPST